MKVLPRQLPCIFMSVWKKPVILTWDMEILPAESLIIWQTSVNFRLMWFPLTGGVNYYLPNTRSSIFNAKLYLTPAPLLMASEDIVKAMEQEPSVKQIRHMATLAQMSIVGIGGVDSNATLLTNGTLNHSDVLLLSMQGAVGDMLCHFIDKDGNVIQSSLERRLMSTPLEQLKEMSNSIGVAGGSTKSEAILAALKGNYLDVLITDETTATNVLRLKNQE